VLQTYAKPEATSYKSNQRMMRDRAKHVRERLDARDKYARPITESQRIGWFQEVYKPAAPTHGKVACKETKLIEHAMLTQDVKPMSGAKGRALMNAVQQIGRRGRVED